MRTPPRTRTGLTALLAAAALAVTAAGCGSAAEEAGGSPAKTGDGGAGGGITVSHLKGSTTLKAPARKVVALEWTYAEDLLALGVSPAGVADVEGYGQWVTAGPRFGADVKDVGTRQAPSLETIKALKPDLIITSKVRSEANYEQLDEIAPTLMFDPYSTESEYEEMRATLKTIGTAVGKPEAADAALKDLDAKIGAAKRKLAAGKRNGAEVTVARGYTTDGAAVVEVLTDSTIPGALLPRLGLRNAWQGRADAYGMSKVDIEGLKPVEKSTLVYVAAKDDDVFAASLPKNALWRNLDFARNERVHALDPGTWFFGGPFSTGQVADEIADALAS
ncbi:iron-siderophore ABC transporter substrate-binding protein [Streptomyces somaliensis DSM 40738]|uniref:Iron-siderophore ABC transporter substrate-binding protein n=1 Tax=Streptomyces somaliensis (strain ATCC 33201 / DSM 40738 / JCM 12659 / KCTC 9044 / NCTC 11332 / NRRL B-12077 / IP 733) TaxID=1134445 RepID=A0AA44DD34_STRE0|nr:iron-siderophore ABC transporter substrate-binding protein [Streptomyces somaliensis]MCQ0025204.1 iron-siderophore ABC transporter substrate-binding protein [Streptomyces somaliensis DSM 40738]NKY14522.1 iron-siderophore ABC transporter substrate-binding protein [Streptomyces somaliensis DSM 40738]